jgi:8-oxo-dGTP pyrophosphatase MutT (NUDIX family)
MSTEGAPPAPPPFTSADSLASFRVAMKEYLKTNEQYDAIAVGAMVYDEAGKLLLLQRAAHDSMPLRWEVPGGACDWEDDSILHGLVRELWEESGLVATKISRIVRCGDEDGAVFFTRRNRRICKFTFEVEVKEGPVKLDPNEHQAFVWASEDELRAGKCGDTEIKLTTQGQASTIWEGFRLRKEDASGNAT